MQRPGFGSVPLQRSVSQMRESRRNAAFADYVGGQVGHEYSEWGERSAFEVAAPQPIRARPLPLLGLPETQSLPEIQPRQTQRRDEDEGMRTSPLHRTAQGRDIIALTGYSWFALPNSLCVMQFGENESPWRCNQMALLINNLRCGAYSHRSMQLNLIAVENMRCLNARFARDRVYRILPRNYHPSVIRGYIPNILPFMRNDYEPITQRAGSEASSNLRIARQRQADIPDTDASNADRRNIPAPPTRPAPTYPTF